MKFFLIKLKKTAYGVDRTLIESFEVRVLSAACVNLAYLYEFIDLHYKISYDVMYEFTCNTLK